MTLAETEILEATLRRLVKSEENPLYKEVESFVQQFILVTDPGYEWIADGEGKSSGLLFRGTGAKMTNAVVDWLEKKGIPSPARAAFQAMANQFPQSQCYFKQEWRLDASEPKGRMGCYFKNGIEVQPLLSFLEKEGVHPQLLSNVHAWTQLMDKEQAHFAALALNPDGDFFWKIYLSESIGPDNLAQVQNSLASTMEKLGIHPAARQNLLAYFPHLFQPGQNSQLFSSLSFSQAELFPTLKLDVRDMNIAKWLELLPSEVRIRQKSLLDELDFEGEKECISYLGIRVSESPRAHLKYYMDHEN